MADKNPKHKYKLLLNSNKDEYLINKTYKTMTELNFGITRNMNTVIMAMIVAIILAVAQISECQSNNHAPISQISPKSIGNIEIDLKSYASTAQLTIEGTQSDATIESSSKSTIENDANEDNETNAHLRVERSALPVLNDNYPKTGINEVNFPIEEEKDAVAGRYFHYNIKPTGILETEATNAAETHRVRSGKTLEISDTDASTTPSSFLLKGDLRQLTSGSLISPTSSTATSMAATGATIAHHNARQNGNPDIQDIITGIVKLLNGNVNVHANTQGLRRPSASRINNRGPPRISDVPPLDFDTQHHGTSMRPQPFPFDRPERPFITGVPIPEQIVPYRPGFVSNRPPWHRTKPRPPITTSIGGRRPLPQYKPLPSTQMKPPDEQIDPVMEQQHNDREEQLEHHFDEENSNVPGQAEHAARPTDTTYDSEFSNEDTNTQYIEVSDDTELDATAAAAAVEEEFEEEPQPTVAVVHKKEETNSKKKPNKHKGNDKKKQNHDYTTIIETSSEVHTFIGMPSTYLPMPMASAEDVDSDSTSDEVIFMTTSRTPAIETTTSTTTTAKPISEMVAHSNGIVNTEIIDNDMPNSYRPHFEIEPTPVNFHPIPSTTTTTTSTTTTTTIATTEELPTDNTNMIPSPTPSAVPPQQYQPRPGIVLDDPEFKPGGRPRPPRPQQQQPYPSKPPPSSIQPTRQHLPPGYGEIFDVTLSAIQGPGSVSGSKQTINIKPFGSFGGSGDIIVSASGEDGFVSIDGKRTYINLFGDPTDSPAGVQAATTPATALSQLPTASGSGAELTNPGSNANDPTPTQLTTKASNGASGAGPSTGSGTGVGGSFGVAETEIIQLEATKTLAPKYPLAQSPQTPTTNALPTRPHYRPRTTQPPVRIDTCIVGDDSTCDQAQHERCKTENGVSSCHCRPGYSRRKHREPCRKVISFYIGMRVDKIYEHRIVWDNKLMDRNSEPYGQLSYESIRAIDSAMSMTPYSDEFLQAKVNNIYRGDPNFGGSGVFVNLTIKLDESVETLRPNLRSDVQKHLLGVLHRRNNNIGNSVLYVNAPEGAISALHDLDECQSSALNDCHASATCTNAWGSFHCTCDAGYRDPWADQPQRAGRECQSCSDTYCNNHGVCSYNDDGIQVCACDSSHYGGQCEIDGEVLGVAIGASVAAVIIIVLTLVCLIMWSRRWQREQKNAIGSPVFGYMNTAPLKAAALPQAGYQVTLEDRMRWAQIADVMAQTNHYGAEPIGSTRPSSAMFAYPNLQHLGMGGTIGGLSMQSTMQMHQGGGLAPPVPLPRRLGLNSRSNGMRTLENSSSSEEEDRTDLLGRNFQVPRPKSRSNGSIANQSGIYYDVDYEPSGNGIGNTSVDHLYGSQNQSTTHSHMGSNSHIPGPQGIPMSTYTSGRAPSSYYMK